MVGPVLIAVCLGWIKLETKLNSIQSVHQNGPLLDDLNNIFIIRIIDNHIIPGCKELLHTVKVTSIRFICCNSDSVVYIDIDNTSYLIVYMDFLQRIWLNSMNYYLSRR